jgi:hypothetical protein
MCFVGRTLLAAAMVIAASNAVAATVPATPVPTAVKQAHPARTCLKRSKLGRCERWSQTVRHKAPTSTATTDGRHEH